MLSTQGWMLRAGEFPQNDSQYLELMARAVFSAGLGPRVVDSRWERITEWFRDFDPQAVGAMDEEHVKDMLADRGVIRNRRKIEAVIENARLLLDVVAEHGGFHEYVRFLGADEDPEGAADELSGRFHHLGRTSSLFFLFSAGWRDLSNDAEEVEVDQAS